ncbi:PLP-dependent transferase [Russula earlei]|uniref:PLP-dependent transferase n=1 Tax=Russula earlei TaxID=71964 RepID=A0ACC0UPD8_9AGAM|nr:PLP-dependent transferase [Russula earlei]
MSLLFKNFRVHQVFGANTDVGKTILTSGLVRASAAKKNHVFYLKPVSTGPMHDADDEHVKRYAGPLGALVTARCLYRFDEPVSPHLAAEREGAQNVPTDDAFVTSVASYIRKCASGTTERSHMYIETAGGVHSPTPSGTTQLDSYRPLFLPTILVGDSRLGGISSTISAYESLLLRGFVVDAVLLFKDPYHRNSEYLEPYLAERGVKVSAVDPPPPREADARKNFMVTEEYYRKLASDDRAGGLLGVVEHLDERHEGRIKELHSMPRRALDTVWWPFVQHGLLKGEGDVNVIDSAWGDHFSVFNGHRRSSSSSSPPSTAGLGSLLESQFDGSASWWTQALGHAHPALTLAAARAAGRYGHVMYPRAIHAPALRLAERLVHDGPGKGWAARAFISDNGSTGMEIALKMALRVASRRFGLAPRERKTMGVLGLRGSYHGDTIGSMDACEEGVYTCEWHQAKGYWFEPPTVEIENGRASVRVPSAVAHRDVEGRSLSPSWIYDVGARLDTPLARAYRDLVDGTLEKLAGRPGAAPLGALVLEPLVLGAGGMVFVDPLFQRVLVDAARARGLPVVFDEVFSGLWRLGLRSAAAALGAHPDVAVYGKALTGGLVPLAATLATEDVFGAFEGPDKAEALLHGHSYSAYAVGCEVANVALERLERLGVGETWSDARAAWGAVGVARAGAGERREGATPANAGGGAAAAPAPAPASASATVWSVWSPGFVDVLSKLEIVDHAMTLGTVLAFKVRGGDAGYESHSAEALLNTLGDAVGGSGRNVTSVPGGAPSGINFRTLGDVAYFMTSLNTPPATIRAVEDRIWAVLGR